MLSEKHLAESASAHMCTQIVSLHPTTAQGTLRTHQHPHHCHPASPLPVECRPASIGQFCCNCKAVRKISTTLVQKSQSIFSKPIAPTDSSLLPISDSSSLRSFANCSCEIGRHAEPSGPTPVATHRMASTNPCWTSSVPFLPTSTPRPGQP